jgi:hypothetical protein
MVRKEIEHSSRGKDKKAENNAPIGKKQKSNWEIIFFQLGN